MNEDALRLFASLPQQGPGSSADSLAMLKLVQDQLPSAPVVADFGCGTGRLTLLLASHLPDARITAVDAAEIFISELQQTLEERGLTDRVTAVVGEMKTPDMEPGSLDLIWSEGAVYAVGFGAALKAWRPVLKPGGFCIVSECEWLNGDRSAAVSAYWAENYPQMGDRSTNSWTAEDAGFEVVATHTLSNEGWQAYYDGIEAALNSEAGQELGPEFAAVLRQELTIWQASGGSYGYGFYVLRAR